MSTAVYESPEHVHSHDGPVDDLRAVISDGLASLSEDDRRGILEQLVEAVCEFKIAERVDPLLHFARSLATTMTLHRDSEYRDAVARAHAYTGKPSDRSVEELAAWLSGQRS